MGFWNNHTLTRGSFNPLAGGDTGWDIKRRYDEWLLFRDQIYPHGSLASDAERSLPYFRTTVYLPWALPMFAGLFAWGGLMQGKILILVANLAGIATIAFAGKHCFWPWGKAASWFGAFLPLTIRGGAQFLFDRWSVFGRMRGSAHPAVAPASTPKATSGWALLGISHDQTSDSCHICPTAAAAQISKRALAWQWHFGRAQRCCPVAYRHMANRFPCQLAENPAAFCRLIA